MVAVAGATGFDSRSHPPNLAQALVYYPVSFYLGVAWI